MHVTRIISDVVQPRWYINNLSLTLASIFFPLTSTTILIMADTNENGNPASTSRPAQQFPDIAFKDTPSKPRNTQTYEFRESGLDDKRNALLKELSYFIPEYKMDDFMAVFLPTLKMNVTFDDIAQQLVEENVITEVEAGKNDPSGKKKYRLNYFDDAPKNISEPENDVFERFKNHSYPGLTAAVEKKFPGLVKTAQLLQEPNKPPTSGRGSKTRPNAHFRLISSTGSCKWEEISCTGEFKKGARDDVGI